MIIETFKNIVVSENENAQGETPALREPKRLWVKTLKVRSFGTISQVTIEISLNNKSNNIFVVAYCLNEKTIGPIPQPTTLIKEQVQAVCSI